MTIREVRVRLRLLLSLGALIALAAPARPESVAERRPSASLVASHPMLQASLDRISSGSRLWNDALRSLEGSGRRAILLTPDQVRVWDRPSSAASRPFDPEQLAEAWPVVVSGSRISVVLVVVNLPLLRQIHHSQPWSSPANIYQDLDRIVVHEVYGHAFPYLLVGDVSGRCPDPDPGQRPLEACAIQRENAVRAELRLGRREDAGLNGLALARDAAERPRWEPAWFR